MMEKVRSGLWRKEQRKRELRPVSLSVTGSVRMMEPVWETRVMNSIRTPQETSNYHFFMKSE